MADWLEYHSQHAGLIARGTQPKPVPTMKILRNLEVRVLLTPQAAQKKMARVVASFCSDLHILGTLWASFSPFNNYLRPVQFSAAYFPAWIVNAEIETDITYGDARRRGTVIFRNYYIPGSHVPTLSAAPLWADVLNSEEPLPCMIQPSQPELSANESHLFDPSLLKQHGEEVQCIPFTTSPFSLLDIAENLPWKHAVIGEDLKFAPSSLDINLFSAYPVLLPLYIAKYEMKQPDVPPGSTLTTWTLAHTEQSNFMSENFAAKFQDQRTIKAIFTIFKFFGDSLPDSEVFSFVRPERQGKVDMVASQKIPKAIEEWLRKASSSSSNISKLAATIDNDDDFRIRPMVKAEKIALQRYFENEREIILIKRIIKDLKSSRPEVKVLTIGLPSSAEAASATLQAKLNDLLTRKEELTPSWWTQWKSLQSQSQESPQ